LNNYTMILDGPTSLYSTAEWVPWSQDASNLRLPEIKT
jgi:hypothetical protein